MSSTIDEQRLPEGAKGEILVYQDSQGETKLDVHLQNDTVWLTLNQMSELFGVDKSGISRHLKNIYETGELQKEATVAKYATVQNEGGREVRRNTLVGADPRVGPSWLRSDEIRRLHPATRVASWRRTR